ncbi:phosphonoacetaldehyde hydrolase [Rhodopirellula maiorica SM1]|uniref:Phosphonoacetaldehyde hydrolase n=1 Tax=Rhodopirellula maiorica SM1 TaxID=1265738 RepID=M5RS06_9BACT|nr:phosphonoacetaldehyde hydrolase [Rhodopirellula maiorica]EMI22075.1 phosphonoacetaldehyde hydrolase [Rhodopirellula maiorica SM1]
MNTHPAKIRLVIFDWAGTTVDFGSRAPAAAFTDVFKARNVSVTNEQACAPMGLNKRDHLVQMLTAPEIATAWHDVQGREWTEDDVDDLYEAFIPVQLAAIDQHADLVPGLLDVVHELRKRNIKIGGTTGYFRAAADAVAQRAAQAGFTPDANVCSDDVTEGRPAPQMIHRVMQQLTIETPQHVLKIGDTVADIKAGLAANCWSIGVCDSSSLMGLSQTEYAQLSDHDRSQRLREADHVFRHAGAHAVIDTITELPSLIDQINRCENVQPHVLV